MANTVKLRINGTLIEIETPGPPASPYLSESGVHTPMLVPKVLPKNEDIKIEKHEIFDICSSSDENSPDPEPAPADDHEPSGQAKPVLQRALDGTLVKRWPSMMAAAVGNDGALRQHISSCCHGNLNEHKGYLWEFENPEHRKKKQRVPKKPKRSLQQQMFESSDESDKEFDGGLFAQPLELRTPPRAPGSFLASMDHPVRPRAPPERFQQTIHYQGNVEKVKRVKKDTDVYTPGVEDNLCVGHKFPSIRFWPGKGCVCLEKSKKAHCLACFTKNVDEYKCRKCYFCRGNIEELRLDPL